MDLKVITLFNRLYGRDFNSRCKKLREECLELIEAIDNLSIAPKDGELDHFIDEMGDVEALITHIGNILNISRNDILKGAINKVERRIIEPNYKRD